MTATGISASSNTPYSLSATLVEDPADLANALKSKFRQSNCDSEALKEYFKENSDPYTTLITDDEAVKTLHENLRSEQEPEVLGHPSQLADSTIVYAFPGQVAGKKVLNFLTPAAWKKNGHEHFSIPRTNSGHRRSDKIVEAEFRFGQLRKKLTGKGGGYKRASQYSELSELANVIPDPAFTPAVSLEHLPEEEEHVLIGPPPKNLRTLSTGSVQSLPYLGREHPQLIITNPDLPSPPTSPADSLLPRLKVPATIEEEYFSSRSVSSSPTSADSKELKTPEKLTVVLLPEEHGYLGIEPVEKTLSRKNSTPRRSPWDGPIAKGPKKAPKRASTTPHTPSPLRSSPKKLSPASSSDGEEDYSSYSQRPHQPPMIPPGALLAHMGYSARLTPPGPEPRTLAPPQQFYTPHSTPSSYNSTLYSPAVVPQQFTPQFFSPMTMQPQALAPGSPFMSPGPPVFSPYTPPGFVPQSMTPLVGPNIPMPSGGVATMPLPSSPWQPADTMALPYGSPYVATRGRW